MTTREKVKKNLDSDDDFSIIEDLSDLEKEHSDEEDEQKVRTGNQETSQPTLEQITEK